MLPIKPTGLLFVELELLGGKAADDTTHLAALLHQQQQLQWP
jgi:hypothetical protein